jgi:predicted ATP-dependent protease
MKQIFKRYLNRFLNLLNIIPVEWIDEVISHALVNEPTPLNKTSVI